ncbi:MAG: hypothetical protein HOP18_26755 [Deltaproteobacteria bacterium]|nr:hypothetical protein [Deltaproteobacteria bacterium]
MIKIRQEQMDAFATDLRARFASRLVAHVEGKYPEKVWDLARTDLRMRIQATIARAITYGINREEDVAAFVVLTLELGEHFDTESEHEWSQTILRDPTLDGHAKINRIEEALYQVEDHEVAAND